MGSYLMRFATAIILLLFSYLPLFAQQDSTMVVGDSTLTPTAGKVVLSGRVMRFGSDEPMEGVNIFVPELNSGTVTKQGGIYRMSINPGLYEIRFRYLGFETVVKSVRIYSDGELHITMRERLFDLDEMVIEATGSDDNVLSSVTGIEQMSLTDIRELPTVLGEANIMNTLLMLPGVNNVGEGASGFNVRGGRVDQNLVLMDGVPVLNPFHILSLFSVFNPDIAEGFILYKGHIPARYGGRLSSVLDVDIREGSFDRFGFAGGVGIAAGRLLVEGPIHEGKTSILVSGRGSYSDWLLNAVKNQDIRSSSASFYDGNVKLSHRFNDRHRAFLSFYGSHDEFRFADQFGFKWANRIYNLEVKSSFSKDLANSLSISHGSYESINFEPAGVDAFNLDNGLDYFQVKENILLRPFENHLFNAGAKWIGYYSKTEKLNPRGPNSAVISEQNRKENGREFSIYLSDDLTVSSRLLVSMGIRLSLYQNIGPDRVFTYRERVPRSRENIADTLDYADGEVIDTYTGLEPRVSVRYKLGGSNSVKASYNRTRQYIHLISNNTSPAPSDFWQVSTNHIPPQTANNYSLGYYQNWNEDRWEGSLELFYKRVNNLVEYRGFADLFLNEHLETELMSGAGRAYGLEINIKKSSGPWTGWFSYTYSRTRVKVDSEFPDLRINDGNWFPSNYDQPHTLNLSAKRRLMTESAFSVNFSLHSGRPITALEASFIEEDTTVPVFTARNDERIPYYMRFDISLTIADDIWKNWDPDPNRRYQDSMTFSLYNVFSRKNAFSVFYKRPDESTVLPKAHKLSVLGALIPSVTYNFRF